MTDLGADPFLEQLRDVLGALRVLYATTEDELDREVLKKAGDAVTRAFDVASGSRREKELGLCLRRARTAIREAAERAPDWTVILGGALARIPRMRRRR